MGEKHSLVSFSFIWRSLFWHTRFIFSLNLTLWSLREQKPIHHDMKLILTWTDVKSVQDLSSLIWIENRILLLCSFSLNCWGKILLKRITLVVCLFFFLQNKVTWRPPWWGRWQHPRSIWQSHLQVRPKFYFSNKKWNCVRRSKRHLQGSKKLEAKFGWSILQLGEIDTARLGLFYNKSQLIWFGYLI